MVPPRRLPPLTALRAFEAAARHLSFTRAAEELFVTQAAISRQVRELESWLGRPLFRRLHRRVELTEAGALLSGQLTDSFDALARLVQAVREPDTESLRVSVEPALAARWLMPRLARFRRANPVVELLLDSNLAPVRVGTEADLAVRWSLGRTSWPGADAKLLCEVEVFPVLAPALLARGRTLRGPADLLHYPLLYEDDRSFWTRWLAAAGVEGVTPPRGPAFTDLALAMEAAVRGEGVALGEDLVAADDLAAGRLVRPFAQSVRLGAFWLLSPPGGPKGAAAWAFADWVGAEVAATLNVAAA